MGLHPADVRRGTHLRFQVAGGLWSTVLVYWPKAVPEKRRALIWHSGHWSGWAEKWVAVGEALARGYVVAEVSMPGFKFEPLFPQSLPLTYTYPGGGTENIATHDDFANVTLAGQPVLPIFLDPVFRTCQWLRDNVAPVALGLAGWSGGGWTSLMCGALDGDNYDLVASVHGWCPIGAAGEPVRDYEQNAAQWFASLSMGYLDYAKLVGATRQLVLTGSLDPVFGAAALGQPNIDAWTADIQAAGANFAQFTDVTADHNMVAAQAVRILDELDALGPGPAYLAPRYESTLADAAQMASILNALAGYPSVSTAAYAALDIGAGNGRLDTNGPDLDRLYDPAQLASLSGADQAFAVAQRGAFVGR